MNEFVVKNGLISKGNISAAGQAVTASTFIGNLTGTASWANNSVSTSYVNASNVVGTVTSASFAVSASWAPDTETGFATSASWASSSLSSSYVSGSNVIGSVISASHADIVNYFINGTDTSTVIGVGNVTNGATSQSASVVIGYGNNVAGSTGGSGTQLNDVIVIGRNNSTQTPNDSLVGTTLIGNNSTINSHIAISASTFIGGVVFGGGGGAPYSVNDTVLVGKGITTNQTNVDKCIAIGNNTNVSHSGVILIGYGATSSFDRQIVIGSNGPTGSISTIITTPVTASAFKGDLTGTASWASNATSASYAPENAVFVGNKVISGSLAVTNSIELFGYMDFEALTANAPSPNAGEARLHSTTVHGFTRIEQDNEAPTNVILAQDNVFIARNSEANTIAKGSPVYLSGSTGNTPNVKFARANSLSTMGAVGLALDDIASNAYGQIMTVGIMDFNTNAWNQGDELYVDYVTSGSLTNVSPPYPYFSQRMGSVLVKGIGNGVMYVFTSPFIGGSATGTVNGFQISQSLGVSGSATFLSGVTASVQGTASWAQSASWAPGTGASTSASWASQSLSASFASTTAIAQISTASYLSGSIQFTNVTTSFFPYWSNGTLAPSSFLIQQTASISASVPISASILGNATTATTATSATSATVATSASWASASYYAISASWASGSQAASSTSSSWASASIWASSASFASSSVTASYLSGSIQFTNVTNSFFPFWQNNTLSTSSFWIQQTASLSASVPISGTLLGTASYANAALSASYAANATLPSRLSVTDITASQALIVGAGTDSSGGTFYVSASNRGQYNIVEIDDAYGNECFAIGPSGSFIHSASIAIPFIFRNNINNESEIFNQNTNAGNTASVDIIVASDLSTTASYQAGYYLDMGMNSSQYNYGFVGGANDTYLFCSSSNSSSFYIGNLDTNGGNVAIFAGNYQNTGSGLTIYSSSVKSATNLVAPTLIGSAYQMTQSYTTSQLNSYTITNSDNGKLVVVNSGSTLTITLTTSSIDSGWSAMYYQSGSSKFTFTTASTSVTMRNRAGFYSSAGQYAVVNVMRVPNGDFIIGGDTGP